MISICIPIYNNDVTQLVQALEQQLIVLEVEAEVILMDDASKKYFRKINKQLSSDYTSYHQLPENIGRAAIRNRLALAACYDHLLFLDNDSIVDRGDFLNKYIDNRNDGVVYGGRIYDSKYMKPNQLLHFSYGRQREAKPVTDRRKAPYRSFQTNNFLISRSVLLKNPFEESLTTYGHEDTLFSITLKQHQIIIHHIDNPVIHGELETNEIFLHKSKEAVENLYRIYHQELINRQSLANEVLLINWFEKLRKARLLEISRLLLQQFRKNWERNLSQFSGNGLWQINALKLLYLLQFHHQRR